MKKRSPVKQKIFGKKSPQGGHLVIGNRAVHEVVFHKLKNISNIYVTQGNKSLSDDMKRELASQKIPIEFLAKDELSFLCGTDSHQGIIARMKGDSSIAIDAFLRKVEDKSAVFLVALDSIFDPQNLGTILRSSECFGVDGVIWSKNRGVDLTPSATKASAGASELIDVIKVSNLSQALGLFSDRGFEIVAADAEKDATPLEQFHFSKKTVLLLGSEGEGIRPLLLKQANHRVFIPMRGKIASLNVSQAAAVILSWWSLKTHLMP